MKKLRVVLSVLLAFALLLTLVSCASSSKNSDEEEEPKTRRSRSSDADEEEDVSRSDAETGAIAPDGESVTSDGKEQTSAEPEKTSKKDIKVGFIFLHDENSAYDMNFIEAAQAACAALGVNYVLKRNIDEMSVCYETCEDLIDQGCNLIFADSYGHESYLIQAAKQHPDVEFCHASGVMAHTEGLANFHNAFAAVYEGRYLTGVAAGMKLNQLRDAGKLKGDVPKLGYVGTFTYEEVISSYTAFFLGARSVCPDVYMDVTFTGSWYDISLEKAAAEKLISLGCDLLSQHSDSEGVPIVCEKAGVPDVGYNVYYQTACPNTYIACSGIDWQPYFEYIITQAMNNAPMPADWTGSLKTGSIRISHINEAAAAPGTSQKIDEVKQQLISETLHVFDTSAFTVNGQTLTTCYANVDIDMDYNKDTQVVSDGYYHESEFRSAPYFDVEIDGITLLDRNY